MDPYATTASPTSEQDSGFPTDDLLAPTANVRSLQTPTSSNSQGRKDFNEQTLSAPTPLPKHVPQTMPTSSLSDKGTPFGPKPTVHVEGPASGDALGINTKAVVGHGKEDDGSEAASSSISISCSLDAGTSGLASGGRSLQPVRGLGTQQSASVHTERRGQRVQKPARGPE